MVVVQYFRQGALSAGSQAVTLTKIQSASGDLNVENLSTEFCFYVELSQKQVSSGEKEKLSWVLGTPFQDAAFSATSHLPIEPANNHLLIEIGPRLNFSTAFSTNAVSICHSIGLNSVSRIECCTRYLIKFNCANQGSGEGFCIPRDVETKIVAALHDRMTQCRYTKPIQTFQLDVNPEPVYEVDVMEKGKDALEKANKDLGLAFDAWDLDYYTELFRDKIKRNPTSVECFDLAQSNSEHSRHWFFKGQMFVDGQEEKDSLFKMVMATQHHSNQNNVIKFNDNSSAILGHSVQLLYPDDPSRPSAYVLKDDNTRHIIFTAETHNFPTGVAPFPGATTGTGGRIRDVQATGRGAHVLAGTAGYSFGNLHIPGYKLPWEDETFEYPNNFATPLEIIIEASNGASDYGNKFGEPVLTGFARSFGLKMPGGDRREWVKPIMFSGGLGQLESTHVKKCSPENDMEVVKVGGPVYRIGVGGGAASSIQVQGDNVAELDFGAVQRGDAEMEQKMNRVIRACIELKQDNPIKSIHDQGAGGNGNVLKEISEPAGAVIKASEFQLGDPTISILELWGAEFQESNAMLVSARDRAMLERIANREKCPVSFVGSITGDGKIRLEDDREAAESETQDRKRQRAELQYPVDLELEHVLGSMPRKVFKLDRARPALEPLSLPAGLTIRDALDRVLRLPAVASKRYLTNKVDRSVTGLVAQQQCVGPLHTPLADVAVTALSHFDTVGSATAIGEQPIKGLIDAECGARMTVGEALTNLVFARITDLKDVKCSGNWMWAAKLPGEGAALVDACRSMCDVMAKLGVAVDGGKDSLSMAARVGSQTIKAPGTLVVSVYAGCPDITATVTPDLKCPQGKGSVLYIPLSPGHHRLGGGALAQCYQQVGNDTPDLDDVQLFVKVFNVTQNLIKGGVLSAGHDVSDGGLVTCLLEMAFAGNHGISINIPSTDKHSAIEVLFAEELGLVVETSGEDAQQVMEAYQAEGATCLLLGHSLKSSQESEICISVGGSEVLREKMTVLRDIWEETSFQLERLQTNPTCVQQEKEGLAHRREPPYKLTFNPEELHQEANLPVPNGIGLSQPKVAVIREEGSNGDREMVSAFHMAGFEVWDVNMQDLCSACVTLDQFKGVAFVGGFSYADVCGSAKGWAATAKFNASVRAQFDAFYHREDTFSLGVCNGCQLMGLLGWVAPDTTSQGQKLEQGVLVTHNVSERYESRFVAVRIEKSPSIMLRDMQGSTLGVWVAHGEGRMVFKDDSIYESVRDGDMAPLRYVDDDGSPTTQYPLNPNGSIDGIAALCSKDGRHLAMMPHPERCVLPWQWPWMPQGWRSKVKQSPWMRMFQNAYIWCTSTS